MPNNGGGSTYRLELAAGDPNYCIYSTGSGGNEIYFNEYGSWIWYSTSANNNAMSLSSGGGLTVGTINVTNVSCSSNLTVGTINVTNVSCSTNIVTPSIYFNSYTAYSPSMSADSNYLYIYGPGSAPNKTTYFYDQISSNKYQWNNNSSANQYFGFSNGSTFINYNAYQLVLQSDRNIVEYDYSSGTAVAVWSSGSAVSDRNLKKNIKKTAKKGIDIINQLEVVDFQYKYPVVDASNNTIYTGLIAQDVEPIVPEAVQWFDISGAVNGGNYLMHNDKLVPYLIKGLQEQNVLINDLLNRVSVLEVKVG